MDKATAALARMKGPVIPLNLCFDETGTLDHQAVAAYVDWLSEQGAPILMLTYGSSEFACLDDEDIWAVTETVGQACAGRAFCIGGTGFWKAAKTRDYLAHAQAVGHGRGQSPSPSLSGQYHAGPNQLLRRLGRGR